MRDNVRPALHDGSASLVVSRVCAIQAICIEDGTRGETQVCKIRNCAREIVSEGGDGALLSRVLARWLTADYSRRGRDWG